MTPVRIFLGTENGLRTGIVGSSGFTLEHRGLQGQAVRSLAVHPAEAETVYIGCGLRGWGLHRTRDAGQTLESLGFEDRWVWGVTLDPTDPETVYIGTEPPALYRSEDGGQTFTELPGATAVPSRDTWTFYHEPFGDGHIHSVAIHPEYPDRLIAGVEDGPLLISDDRGDTWTETLTGHDVHRIAIDPDTPERWLVGTEDGLFETRDAGNSWIQHESLAGLYTHGVSFSPHDSQRIWVYTNSPAPVFLSDNGGESWSTCGDLPKSRAADPIALHPDDPDTALYAGGTTVGELFVTTDGGETWETVATDLPNIWRITATPIQ